MTAADRLRHLHQEAQKRECESIVQHYDRRIELLYGLADALPVLADALEAADTAANDVPFNCSCEWTVRDDVFIRTKECQNHIDMSRLRDALAVVADALNPKETTP